MHNRKILQNKNCPDVEGHLAVISGSLNNIYMTDPSDSFAIEHNTFSEKDCDYISFEEILYKLYDFQKQLQIKESEYNTLKSNYEKLREHHNQLLIKYIKRGRVTPVEEAYYNILDGKYK